MTYTKQLFLILTLFVSTPLFAQLGHNWYQCNVSPGTRSVLVERFDAVERDGHIVAGARSSSMSDVYGFESDYQLYFKPCGLVQSKYLIKDGKRTGAYNHYTYDYSFRILKNDLVVSNKKCVTRDLYTYFGERKALHKIKYRKRVLAYKEAIFNIPGSSKFALEYDSLNRQGQIVRSLGKQPNGGTAYTRINTYNYNGLLHKSVWSRKIYNSLTHKLAYVYTKEFIYRYTYNKRGDWTQVRIHLDGTPVMIAKRKLTYKTVAPRPISNEKIDTQINMIADEFLKAPDNTKLVDAFQQCIYKLQGQYADLLKLLDEANPALKHTNIYREFMSQDARRHRYMDTYGALASNLTGKDLVGIPRNDFEEIIIPDFRWNGWRLGKIDITCPGIKLYEFRKEQFKMILAINTLPAAPQNNLDIEYTLDGESTSHTCMLNGSECRVLHHGGGHDGVYRKLLRIKRL